MALLVTFVAIDKINPPEAKKSGKPTGGAEPRPQRVDKPILSFRGAPQGYLLRGAKRRGNPQSFSCKFAEKRKNCAIWEQIATPVCGLARNDRLFRQPGAGQSPAPTHLLMYRVSVPCLSLWERWPSAARTERVNNDHLVLLFKKAARPSQSPAVTALLKGEPRICAPLYRRIPRRREAVRPCNRLPTEWPSYFPKMQIIFYCGEKKPLIS